VEQPKRQLISDRVIGTVVCTCLFHSILFPWKAEWNSSHENKMCVVKPSVQEWQSSLGAVRRGNYRHTSSDWSHASDTLIVVARYAIPLVSKACYLAVQYFGVYNRIRDFEVNLTDTVLCCFRILASCSFLRRHRHSLLMLNLFLLFITIYSAGLFTAWQILIVPKDIPFSFIAFVPTRHGQAGTQHFLSLLLRPY
jgi:hypothetical protein